MSTPKCLKATAGRAKGSRIPLKSSPVTIGRSGDNRMFTNFAADSEGVDVDAIIA